MYWRGSTSHGTSRGRTCRRLVAPQLGGYLKVRDVAESGRPDDKLKRPGVGAAPVAEVDKQADRVVGVMHVKNTLHIGEIEISSTLLERAKEIPHLDVDPDGHELAFDATGRVIDVWGNGH